MPIYELYCGPCHSLFNFFSPRVDTVTGPPCPRCGGGLERRPASFAIGGRHKQEDDAGADDMLAGVDEARLTGAMESLARELESLGEGAEDDPRRTAEMLRRASRAAGLEPGPRLEEMLARLEAGEEPEEVEADLEDGADDDPEALLGELFRRRGQRAGRRPPPRRDPELYFF